MCEHVRVRVRTQSFFQIKCTHPSLLSWWRKKSLAASLMAFSGVTSVRFTAAPTINNNLKHFQKWNQILIQLYKIEQTKNKDYFQIEC